MIRKITILLILIHGLWIMDCGLVFAQEEAEEAEQRVKEAQGILKEMRAIPDLVSPDSIYTTTQLRALYYQNIQIIDLLKQIRSLLQQQLEKQG
ncbi:MAG: hypothetical protein KJ902_04285 [Candidatus Omnitrophica bacterium]|nr:hypothetical protein [Candidatus Omnitrophota bacterium]MBU4457944.1 hypothetical protein [Candidatus Omnitrophota bacterium]